MHSGIRISFGLLAMCASILSAGCRGCGNGLETGEGADDDGGGSPFQDAALVDGNVAITDHAVEDRATAGQDAGAAIDAASPTDSEVQADTLGATDGAAQTQDTFAHTDDAALAQDASQLADALGATDLAGGTPDTAAHTTDSAGASDAGADSGNLCADVSCTALDLCHLAGNCDPQTGECSNPDKVCSAPQNGSAECVSDTGCQVRCDDGYLLCSEQCPACPTHASASACQGSRCVATGCQDGYEVCSGACCLPVSELRFEHDRYINGGPGTCFRTYVKSVNSDGIERPVATPETVGLASADGQVVFYFISISLSHCSPSAQTSSVSFQAGTSRIAVDFMAPIGSHQVSAQATHLAPGTAQVDIIDCADWAQDCSTKPCCTATESLACHTSQHCCVPAGGRTTNSTHCCSGAVGAGVCW